MALPRELLLARTLVELADTLVDNFDIVDLLTLLTDRCVEALDVSEAGLMLASPGGDLRVMASSSDATRILELFELQTEEGPGTECYRSAAPVVQEKLEEVADRWPRFAPRARQAGFRSVHALPMHLRNQTIGALSLFRTNEGALAEADLVAAQAFADVATIAILQQRVVADAWVVNEQLHTALSTRIIIEQAKGVVAERSGLDMEQSFSRMRSYARSRGLRLADVAQAIIDGLLLDVDLDSRIPAEKSEKPV
jgi:transcriptional regulator with GAF, ATPase, and Fis domain